MSLIRFDVRCTTLTMHDVLFQCPIRREDVRERAQILITNPDMLHVSILPVHAQFARLLANMSFCVIDEAHMYRGAFGAHTALVLRRLQRLCRRVYASSPTFVATTATVANPQEHAARLLGVPEVTLVHEDGSPHGPKRFVLWNPPLMSPNAGDGTKLGASKRAQQESQRAMVRAARQQRNCGARLGTNEFPEEQWQATVGAGQRDPVVKAAAKTISSPPKQRVSMTPETRRLAMEAAAALSSCAGPSIGGSATAGAPAFASQRPTHERGLIQVAAAASEAITAGMKGANVTARRPDSIVAHGAAGHENSSTEGASLRERMPSTVAHKARFGTAGVGAESRRSSPIVEIAMLLAECVQHGMRTIAFCKTRKLSELVMAYCKEVLATTAPAKEGAVAVYRAGYR